MRLFTFMIFLLLGGCSTAAEESASSEGKVGFVDLNRVLRQYQKLEEIEAALASKVQQNTANSLGTKRRRREQLGAEYKEVLQAVEAVARRQGLAAVFQAPELAVHERGTGSSLNLLANRKTIWMSQKVDITDEVIRFLNK